MPAFLSSLLVQNSLTAFPIARFGTQEQQAKYLPRMARGELIGCFGLTEPNTGSDAKAIRCKATWDKARKGWLVNGAKRFITSANAAGVMVLAARTGNPKSGAVASRPCSPRSAPAAEGRGFRLRQGRAGRVAAL